MDKTNCINCGKLIYDNVNFCPYCKKEQSSGFTQNELQKDPYEILQISREAEQEVINAAYKSLSKKYHPDVDSSGDAQERMKDLNWAYSVLNNSEKRREWDHKKSGGQRSSPPKKETNTTTRNATREKSQAANQTKKPQNQQKSTPRTKEKRQKGISRGRGAFLAIIIFVGGVLLLFSLINSTNQPPTSSYNQPRKSSIPPSVKPTSTSPKPAKTPKPPTSTADPSTIRPPYYEPFENDRGLWYVGDDEEASFTISNGEYLIKPKNAGGGFWASPNANLDDVVLEFTTKFKYTYPSEDGGFFVNFRCENSDQDKCYTLFVHEDGYLMILSNERVLVDYGFSNHINLYDTPNDWAIVMHGNNFAIYCNEKLLTTFHNYNLRRGDFGFGVKNSESDEWGFNGVSFDDIRVIPKNDPSSFSLPTPTQRLSFSDYAATMEVKGYKLVPRATKQPGWAKQTLQAP